MTKKSLEGELKEAREELKKVKKARKDLDRKGADNWRELQGLKKDRPLIFGEVELKKRDLAEKEELKMTIKRLEEESEDIDFVLPWLEEREKKLKERIEDLELKKEARERQLERYNKLKESYPSVYQEERDLEKRGIKDTRYIPPTTARVERIKLEELARDLGMKEDCKKFLKTIEEKYGKLKEK